MLPARARRSFRPTAVGYFCHVQVLLESRRKCTVTVSPFDAVRADPRDIATSAMTAGRFHEVVASTSKAIHAAELDQADRRTLRWAKEMLRSAAAAEAAVVSIPSSTELSGPANPIRILRRAARSEDGAVPDVFLKDLSKSLGHVLSGRQLDGDLIKSLECVRALFSMMSKMSLRAEVVTQTEQTSPDAWLPSMMTLPS